MSSTRRYLRQQTQTSPQSQTSRCTSLPHLGKNSASNLSKFSSIHPQSGLNVSKSTFTLQQQATGRNQIDPASLWSPLVLTQKLASRTDQITTILWKDQGLVIQPKFFESRGTMCSADLWSDKQKMSFFQYTDKEMNSNSCGVRQMLVKRFEDGGVIVFRPEKKREKAMLSRAVEDIRQGVKVITHTTEEEISEHDRSKVLLDIQARIFHKKQFQRRESVSIRYLPRIEEPFNLLEGDEHLPQNLKDSAESDGITSFKSSLRKNSFLLSPETSFLDQKYHLRHINQLNLSPQPRELDKNLSFSHSGPSIIDKLKVITTVRRPSSLLSGVFSSKSLVKTSKSQSMLTATASALGEVSASVCDNSKDLSDLCTETSMYKRNNSSRFDDQVKSIIEDCNQTLEQNAALSFQIAANNIEQKRRQQLQKITNFFR